MPHIVLVGELDEARVPSLAEALSQYVHQHASEREIASELVVA